MSVIKPESILGYLECVLPSQGQVHSILGYIEWIGTPSPIALVTDSEIDVVTAYIEYKYPRANQQLASVLGYLECVLPSVSNIHTVLGYIEWIGTPSPIALVTDQQIDSVIAYFEYVDEGTRGSQIIPVPIIPIIYVYVW